MNNSLACKEISTGHLQKNVSFNKSELLSYEKKCINLANSTFNLYVVYIKLAQNTKQFRRLVLENFITVINFLFGSKAFYGLRPWVFGLLNISPPPCASKPLPYNV